MDITLRQAMERGLRPRETTAAEVFALLESAGRDMKLWQSYGVVRGRGEMFAVRLFHANHEKQRVEHLNSLGQVVVGYLVEPGVSHARPGRMLVK